MKHYTLLGAGLLAATLFASSGALRADTPEVTVYKDPNCGCCGKWAEHMREAGFAVKEVPSNAMNGIKQQLGVPEALGSCHTAKVGNYVIEGHVPAADVKKLLADAPPQTLGLAAPGMPMGSPGMEGPYPADRYDVMRFNRDGSQAVFASH